MQRTVPEHAPLVAGNVMCHTCGSILKPIPVKGRNGVNAIRYECRNKDTGCSYMVESTAYLASEVVPILPAAEAVAAK